MLPLLRFTLDLFDQAFEPAAKDPSGHGAIKNRVNGGPPVSPVPSKPAPPAVTLPFVPGQPLQQAIAPVRFAHPTANREIVLGDARIAYTFARGRRRTIGFSVGAEGLTVRASSWTPVHEVEAALRQKADWIVRKLDETRARSERQDAARIVWAHGASFPLLGRSVLLQLDPAHHFKAKGASLQASASPELPSTLHVALPSTASEAQLRDAVQAWLMRYAHAHFQQRLDHFAPLLQVQWKSLRLSNAHTRWGSAKSDGSIRLNWRLIHMREPVIDYVVAHELSHLRVMDHSPRFWDTVETVVPGYADLRQQLKAQAVPKW